MGRGTTFQAEHGHFRSKVGPCPFCSGKMAQLWYEPDTVDYQPFQVRCKDCGARGPWCDCGEEVAVPAWLAVVARQRRPPDLTQITPEMIAAAWAAWKPRHKDRVGPGPAFREAIIAALEAAPARVRSGEDGHG